MSLPRNIDLTEHRDFGGNRFIPLHSTTPLDLGMTNEEYEKWIARERIFGRRSHKDQRNDIFNDPEEDIDKHWKHTCLRCGKNIRIPWNNIGGICKECDKDLSYNKVPWKKEETVSWGVFDLR